MIAAWLIHFISRTIQPLRSTSITEASSLLRVDPPLCLASVLLSWWVPHLDGSLDIETTGSQVALASLKRTHATLTPDAALAARRFAPPDGYIQNLSRETAHPRF